MQKEVNTYAEIRWIIFRYFSRRFGSSLYLQMAGQKKIEKDS